MDEGNQAHTSDGRLPGKTRRVKMSSTVTKEELQRLIEERSKWCVSLYMPTHRKGAEIQQGPIRLKYLLRQTEKALKERSCPSAEVKTLLSPIERLLQDSAFWRHQKEGLAILGSPSFFRHYLLSTECEEFFWVGPRFYLKPFVSWDAQAWRFYVLALSQRSRRLLACSKDQWQEIELDEAPANLEEALRFDVQEKQLQWHTGAPSAGDTRAAMFHGQGVGHDDDNDRLVRYCRAINAHIDVQLKHATDPLILAGVDHVMALYRQVNTYPHLHQTGISGNPDDLTGEALQRKGWNLLQPDVDETLEKVKARYQESASTGKGSDNITEVVSATMQGRVDVLFVAQNTHLWGTVDPLVFPIDFRMPKIVEAEDLLDFAAIQTFMKHGTVYALPREGMPGQTDLAAIFRY
jgi:hypothetical protein